MRKNRIVKHQKPEVLNPHSIEHTHRGDDRADFERAAIPHMTVLHNRAMFLTTNSDDAKDLLQETYLKAYRFWDKFEKGTNVKAWLYEIMKNSYINHYRKKTKEPKPVEFDESLIHHLHPRNPPSELRQIEAKAPHDVFEDEIALSLESLPSDFRTVVILSDMEDLTYEEIANVIAVPLGTVRSRLHRGRRLLRERLQDYASSNRYLL
jgi:RNA polymerase sigma-70 factor (ECF subfamily)